MHPFSSIYLIVAAVLTFFSCDRVERKGHQVFDHTKEVIADKKASLADKIIARYDPYHPDTKFNKKRFREFFMFEPTTAVKDIYCYADEIGIDQDFQFAFSCNTMTIHKIVFNLDLKKETQADDFGSGFWHNFPGWDSTKMRTLTPYCKKGEHETYGY